MPNVNLFCFLASYVVALVCDIGRARTKSTWLRWTSMTFGAAGLVAQTIYLLIRSNQTNLPPLLSSSHDWLLVLAWLTVLTHLFVTLIDAELATGLFVWPVVLALVAVSWFVPTGTSEVLNAHRGWTMLHASMLVLGTAGVLLAFVISLLYLWQHRRLKHRQAGRGLMLPNLELLERFNRWSILTAVPLLTLGVASGVGLTMIKSQQAMLAWTDPIVIGGAVAWLLMCGLFVWLLTRQRTPGRRVALLTAWSCGFLLLTIVGLQLLTSALKVPSVHGRDVVKAK